MTGQTLALLDDSNLELEHWCAQGLVLPVWWRDDDAIEPTPALDRLLALAERYEAPLHLAVIPNLAKPELAKRLRYARHVFALTHGWEHANHASQGKKKAEFGPYRPLPAMLNEITAGRSRIEELFGNRALPIFTPPWNRIAPEVVEQLAATGFKALSTYLPRRAKFATSGLLQINTHLDPVAWKSGGGLLDPVALDAQIAQDLQARRLGNADNSEPYGLLTHHLVQDEATWLFVERLLKTFANSGVARWTPPLESY